MAFDYNVSINSQLQFNMLCAALYEMTDQAVCLCQSRANGINGATDCVTQQDLPVGLIPKVAHVHAKADSLVKKLQKRRKTHPFYNWGISIENCSSAF